ncbi:hypothetical protein ACFL34_01085 [Candidatus Sumerlaeota bacterium]
MFLRPRKLSTCLVGVLTVAMLTTPAIGDDTKPAEKQPLTEKKSLTEIFKPIMVELGMLNVQRAKIVAGPTAVKMRRDNKPGKQWQVALGRTEFKITIADDAAKDWSVQQAIALAEKIPVLYRQCLKPISADGKEGLAFYSALKTPDTSKDHLALAPGAKPIVLAGEAGRLFAQVVQAKEADLLARWAAAIKEDGVSVSQRGDKNAAEDMAELARLWAHCTDHAVGRGLTRQVKQVSPKRVELWQHILKQNDAERLLHLDVEFNPLGGPLKMGNGNTDNAKIKILSGPTKVKMKQYSRPENKMITIHAKQWSVSLGKSKFKITREDVEDMPSTLEENIKLVETLPPRCRIGLVAVSEENETGLTIYKGGCAYGVPDRIGMGGKNLRATTIAHECGHTTDQYARKIDKDIMTKWGLAKMRDDVRISGYGNGAIHEGHAEFTRLYAIALAHSPEYFAKLRKLSPTRFAVWERMLVITGGMPAEEAAPAIEFDFDAGLKQLTKVTEEMKPRIKEVHDTIKAIEAAGKGNG